MDFLIVLLLGVLAFVSFMHILVRGELSVLQRAISIADKETDFIDKLESWEKQNSIHSGFGSGIDPHDVLSTINIAKMNGEASIQKELKKYGSISQL